MGVDLHKGDDRGGDDAPDRAVARASGSSVSSVEPADAGPGLPAPVVAFISAGWPALWILVFIFGPWQLGLVLLFLTAPVMAAVHRAGRGQAHRARAVGDGRDRPDRRRERRQRHGHRGRSASSAPAPAPAVSPGFPPEPVREPGTRPVTGSGTGSGMGPVTSTSAAERSLAAAVVAAETSGGRLDADVVGLVREVDHLLRPLLARVRARGADAQVARDVEALAGEHLPAALDAYLALPADYARGHRTRNGTTPADELRAQLTLLVEGCRQLREAVHDADVDRQQELGRYLEAKFRRSDLDL